MGYPGAITLPSFTVLDGDALETSSFFSSGYVSRVLRWGCSSKIFNSIVRAVLVDVINIHGHEAIVPKKNQSMQVILFFFDPNSPVGFFIVDCSIENVPDFFIIPGSFLFGNCEPSVRVIPVPFFQIFKTNHSYGLTEPSE